MMSNRQLLSVTRVMSESLNEARGRAAVMKATVVVCPNKKSDDSEFTKKTVWITLFQGQIVINIFCKIV
jgi:hypothetical protein